MTTIPYKGTTAPPPTPLRLLLIFGRIGLTSFGGGLSGWLLREVVEDRQWLTEEAFINGLAISQALPGVNVTNLSIWIGYNLLGWRGAAAGLAGIIAPAAIVIVLLGVLFSELARFPLTHLALDGATAAAIGLSLSMGIRTVRRVPRRAVPLLLLSITFVAVGILRWPLLWVLVGAGSVGVATEYARLARS